MSLTPSRKLILPAADTALPGRPARMAVPAAHLVLGRALVPPYPEGMLSAQFGMGCFWGAERRFWQKAGIWTTAVGYSGGFTPNPTYEEVCTGQTGHVETVLVVWDPEVISFAELLTLFWESHDPTQGMSQGNDIGTQYRSALYVPPGPLLTQALASRDAFQQPLSAAGFGPITTEVGPEPEFFYAEPYHQQYLARNPTGYCGLRGTGVTCD